MITFTLLHIYIYSSESGLCVRCVWENNHFCFDRAWTAKGEKLLLKRLLVLVLVDLNRRLDGRGSKRSWAGWDESWEITVALPNRRCWYSISRLGRSLLMIREAVFTTLYMISYYMVLYDMTLYGIIWYDMIWYDMIWYDMLWYDMIWYDMIWYGMVWYGMVWYGMVWYGMVWYGMVWYGMVWYGMIWYDMIWYDMIWYDMIWYDMIWYDMIWYDMIWYDMISLW